MSSTSRFVLLWTVLICLVGAGLLPGESRAGENDLLVFPSRNAVVKLAFDVESLRSAAMLSYEKGVEDPSQPFMHIWDSVSRAWVETDMDTYSSGNALTPAPKRVFIIGLDAELTQPFNAASSWCDDVTTIPSLHSLDILNGLDAKMKFSGSEWKWLAGRYKLELNDDNEGRRKHGRFGPRGAEYEQPERKKNPLVLWFQKKMGKGEEETDVDTLDSVEPVTKDSDAVDLEAEVEKEMAPAVDTSEKGVPEKAPAPKPEVKPQTDEAVIEAAVEAKVKALATPPAAKPVVVDPPAEDK